MKFNKSFNLSINGNNFTDIICHISFKSLDFYSNKKLILTISKDDKGSLYQIDNNLNKDSYVYNIICNIPDKFLINFNNAPLDFIKILQIFFCGYNVCDIKNDIHKYLNNIYTFSEHDLVINDEISKKVLSRLIKFNYDAYLVGGCIRDLLLDINPNDYDIITNAKPEDIVKIFDNARIIKSKRVELVHVIFRTISEKGIKIKTRVDLSTLRTINGNYTNSIYEDYKHRDFTINAIYYNYNNMCIEDPSSKGIYDISNGIIRAINDPEEIFKEDPVRIIRALKLSATLPSFTIEKNTLNALKKDILLIKDVNRDRLYYEFMKMVSNTNTSLQIFKTLISYGILNIMLGSVLLTKNSKFIVLALNVSENPSVILASIIYKNEYINDIDLLKSDLNSILINVPNVVKNNIIKMYEFIKDKKYDKNEVLSYEFFKIYCVATDNKKLLSLV